MDIWRFGRTSRPCILLSCGAFGRASGRGCAVASKQQPVRWVIVREYAPEPAALVEAVKALLAPKGGER